MFTQNSQRFYQRNSPNVANLIIAEARVDPKGPRKVFLVKHHEGGLKKPSFWEPFLLEILTKPLSIA